MALDRYLEILKRRKWVMLAPLLLATAGAVGVTFWTPPVYEASATARIALVGGTADGFVDPREAERLANTYVLILKSRPVLATVVEDLGLAISPEKLRRNIEIEALAGTELIRITAQAGTAEQAERLANALAFALVTEGQEFYAQSASPSLAKSFSIVETAVLPGRAGQTNPIQIIALGLLIGLAGGVGLALVLEYTDPTLRGVRDLAEITALPLLGSISRNGTLVTNGAKPSRELGSAPNVPVSAEHRLLAANLQSLQVQEGLQSIMVTAAWSKEGTTSVAVAGAIALAQSGVDVILVDANLRNPCLHTIFDLPNGRGLTHVLAAASNGSHDFRKSLAAAVESSHICGLSILPSGPTLLESSEFLVTAKLSQLIEVLNNQTHVVVIDAPPFLESGDAAALAPQVSGVVLVCAEGIATTESVERTLEQLHILKANVLGLVYNMAPSP